MNIKKLLANEAKGIAVRAASSAVSSLALDARRLTMIAVAKCDDILAEMNKAGKV